MAKLTPQIVKTMTSAEKAADLYIRGYSVQEISDLLKLEAATVKDDIAKAYANSQQHFAEHGELLLAGDLMRLETLAIDKMQELEKIKIAKDDHGEDLSIFAKTKLSNSVIDRVIKLIELKAKIIQTQATLNTKKGDNTPRDDRYFTVDSDEYRSTVELVESGKYDDVFDNAKEVQNIMQKIQYLKEYTTSPEIKEALEHIFDEGIRVHYDDTDQNNE